MTRSKNQSLPVPVVTDVTNPPVEVVEVQPDPEKIAHMRRFLNLDSATAEEVVQPKSPARKTDPIVKIQFHVVLDLTKYDEDSLPGDSELRAQVKEAAALAFIDAFEFGPEGAVAEIRLS